MRTSLITWHTLVLTCLGLSFSTWANASPITNGLLAWWRAEGNVTDSKGGFDATSVGSVGFTGGAAGQAFSIPSTSGADRLEVVDPSGALSPSQITVEAWVKLSSLSGLHSLVNRFHHSSGSADDAYYLAVRNASGTQQIRWQIQYGPNGPDYDIFYVDLPNGVSLTDGVFHQIVGTYDGQTTKVYLDGALIASRTVVGAIQNMTYPLILGASEGAPGTFANGLGGALDEVRIYDRALSAGEIAHNYTATPNVPEPRSLAGIGVVFGFAVVRARRTRSAEVAA